MKRRHHLKESLKILLHSLLDVKLLLMGDDLGDLGGEHESGFRRSQPSPDKSSRRVSVESGIDLSHVEYCGVVAQFALLLGSVERPDPFIIAPARCPKECVVQTDHVKGYVGIQIIFSVLLWESRKH